MKVAILSDIHGNYPALETVAADVARWQPDVTVVNGDVVNRGPLSHRCWKFVKEGDWRLVGGNHEAYVALWEAPDRPWQGRQFDVHRTSFWTYRQLNGSAAALSDLPSSLSVRGPDGSEVRVTHGSMLGNRDGIYPETSATEIRQKIAPAPAVFCTAHTHRPLVRRVGGALVVNSGSVGASFDGDPRACYVRLTWHAGSWNARLVRLRYDRVQTARDFWNSGFLEEGGPLVHIFYHEWRDARPLVNRWSQQYEGAVLGGEIGLEASVSAFLAAARSPAVVFDRTGVSSRRRGGAAAVSRR